MDTLEVNPSRLADAAENVKEHASGIDDILTELQGRASVLRSQWSGQAQLAFDAAQARFAASVVTRTELATQISDALLALAQAYSDADLNAARALGATA